jgi:hypothetical protein
MIQYTNAKPNQISLDVALLGLASLVIIFFIKLIKDQFD